MIDCEIREIEDRGIYINYYFASILQHIPFINRDSCDGQRNGGTLPKMREGLIPFNRHSHDFKEGKSFRRHINDRSIKNRVLIKRVYIYYTL
jgi:hypothetical protein